jgi:hypothetical protein
MVMAATSVQAALVARAIERANDRWGAYAASKGYAVRPGHTGWARVVNPVVQGKIDELLFTLEYVGEADTTLALATPSTAHEGNVECTPEGLGSKLAKLFGGQDIIVGHAVFDKKYIVKASHEKSAKDMLDGPTCDRLLAVDPTRFAYDDGKSGGKSKGLVLIERKGLHVDPAALDAMADAVCFIARGGA